MAGSLNSVQLIGHLGRDPEIRNTQSGNKVANLRLATTESWKDRNGERQERTEWHSVVIWGPLADVAEKYARKGSRLYVRGALRTRSWESDGVTRYATEVVLQGYGAELILLDGRNGSGSGGGSTGGGGGRTAARDAGGEGSGSSDGWDDEIPF